MKNSDPKIVLLNKNIKKKEKKRKVENITNARAHYGYQN